MLSPTGSGSQGDESISLDFATQVQRIISLGFNTIELPFSFKALQGGNPDEVQTECSITPYEQLKARRSTSPRCAGPAETGSGWGSTKPWHVHQQSEFLRQAGFSRLPWDSRAGRRRCTREKRKQHQTQLPPARVEGFAELESACGTLQEETNPPSIVLPYGTMFPNLTAPPSIANDTCNSYIPSDATLQRFAYIVNFLTANGLYVVRCRKLATGTPSRAAVGPLSRRRNSQS